MAKLSFAEWQSKGGDLADDLSEDAYKRYLDGPDDGAAGETAASKKYNLTLGMSDTPYQRPAGIPAYNGYQAPDYSATTPNTSHWLNTMNAFAPTARNDMSRLLGQGGSGSNHGAFSADGGNWNQSAVMAPVMYDTVHGGKTPGEMDAFYPAKQAIDGTQPRQPDAVFAKSTGLLGQPKPAYSPENYITPNSSGLLGTNTSQNPTQYQMGSQNGLMDAFYNTPYSAYNTKQNTQQNTQNNYQSPTNGWSNGTVGIDPSTGALTFLGNS